MNRFRSVLFTNTLSVLAKWNEKLMKRGFQVERIEDRTTTKSILRYKMTQITIPENIVLPLHVNSDDNAIQSLSASASSITTASVTDSTTAIVSASSPSNSSYSLASRHRFTKSGAMICYEIMKEKLKQWMTKDEIEIIAKENYSNIYQEFVEVTSIATTVGVLIYLNHLIVFAFVDFLSFFC